MAVPDPGPGEVRVRVRFSGVNPGDTKKRSDSLGYGKPFRASCPTVTAPASSTLSARAWTPGGSVSGSGSMARSRIARSVRLRS